MEALPSLVASCARRWNLRLDSPFDGHVSYVAPGKRALGSDVVLKVNFPHPESMTEAIALRHWDGNGAVRLLDENDDARALLLERCEPGSALWQEDEERATEVMADVFSRLWERRAPEGQLQPLANAAKVWSDHLNAAYRKTGAPFEQDSWKRPWPSWAPLRRRELTMSCFIRIFTGATCCCEVMIGW